MFDFDFRPLYVKKVWLENVGARDWIQQEATVPTITRTPNFLRFLQILKVPSKRDQIESTHIKQKVMRIFFF